MSRPPLDVATLVTGLALTGFAVLGGLVAAGRTLIHPASMWFALVLLGAGLIGLVVSFTRRDDHSQDTTPDTETEGNQP